MSLLDYLGDLPNGRSGAASASVSEQIQQLLGAKGLTANGNRSAAAGGAGLASVHITPAAQQAAADAADAKKDPLALANSLRTALDGQKTAGKGIDMSGYSRRALAIVALDESGKFSHAEEAAAKAQLRARDRASALALIGGGDLTAASLKSYNQQLLAARNAMSTEEAKLRDGNPKLR
jgi:hypothetical protein